MATLGQQLKQSREEKNISLQEIAESTHISVRFLQAIENDAYDVLPGGVFNRAFVRKFARQVGFDEEQAVNLYQEQWQEQGGEPERGYQLGVEDFESRQTTGNGLLLSFVALIVIGSLGYAAYQYFAPPVINSGGSAALDVTASPGVTPTSATPSPSPTPSPTPDGAMLVQLSASIEEVWLKVKPDDKKADEWILQPGETREYEISEKIILSIGRVPSLKITINGREMDLAKALANPKAISVSDVVIPKDNYQQYLK
ncbi:MAG TPA: RodZ domain-containing protein [Blastocatellia bacterium]